MKNKNEIQEELTDVSPFLLEIKKKATGFKLPENYFAFLEASIMEQVKLEPKSNLGAFLDKKNILNNFFFRPQIFVSLATTICLVIFTLFFFNKTINSSPVTDISAQEAAIYIADHLDEFETSLFIDQNLFKEISDIEFNEDELNQYLEEIIDELDEATLQHFL